MSGPGRPVQVRGEVLKRHRVGAYHQLSVVAAGVAEQVRPGQFVALAVGGEESGLLLRRAFSVYRTDNRGVYGGTVDVVVAEHGPGTRWLAALRPRDTVDVVGPLGKPFALPKDAVTCALVGGGYGSAPLFGLADHLRARGCRVDVVMGASTEARLFGVLEAKRMSQSVAITTEDGSLGERGRVTDVLPALLSRTHADVVYACGPMAMLSAVTAIAAAHGAHCQAAVEEAMACGIGVCMTCVLPVCSDDGATRMVRSCVDGPVFRGDQVRWDAVGTIPADAVGAPVPGEGAWAEATSP